MYGRVAGFCRSAKLKAVARGGGGWVLKHPPKLLAIF